MPRLSPSLAALVALLVTGAGALAQTPNVGGAHGPVPPAGPPPAATVQGGGVAGTATPLGGAKGVATPAGVAQPTASGEPSAVGSAVLAEATASHDVPHPPRNKWTFSGPFGTFDPAQVQRGFKVYREVCSSCHSMRAIAFRDLSGQGGPNFSLGQVQALAAEYKVKDGPNDSGEMFERPGRPSDRIPPPFPNRQAAEAANGGAYPPDFSVIAKARTYERGFPWFIFDIATTFQEQGVDYIAALLHGYAPTPPGVNVPAGKYYNTYFPGHIISMPPPLNDGQVEYPKGSDGKPPVPETVQQYGKDVAAFLYWASTPHMEVRKKTGFRAILFLVVFALLLWLTKKKVWAGLKDDSGVTPVKV